MFIPFNFVKDKTEGTFNVIHGFSVQQCCIQDGGGCTHGGGGGCTQLILGGEHDQPQGCEELQ